jgi:hypothetical protein
MERRALDADEQQVVSASHYPAICALDQSELVELRKRIRNMRDKARDRLNQQRREMRGKGAPRGVRPAGGDTGSARKLSVLSAALKRVNREHDRADRGAGRRSQPDLSRAALDKVRSATEATG